MKKTFSELSNFTEKQWIATETALSRQFTLFGGSRGPGKSYWLRWFLVYYLLRLAKVDGVLNARVMLACETYPDLYERQITKIQTEFPAELGSYMAAHGEFRLAPEYGGGVIALRNLDKPEKYKSAEFAAIGVDELTADSLRTFNTLRGSLRWQGVTAPRFVAASNPDGKFAQWVRALWIERNFPDELTALSDQFAFVPALPSDNPYLSATYWEMLDSLPEVMRRAWRHGDWFAGTEGLIYPEFSPANIVEVEYDPNGGPLLWGCDDGYARGDGPGSTGYHPRVVLVGQVTAIGGLDILAEYAHTGVTDYNATIDAALAFGYPEPDLAYVDGSAAMFRGALSARGIHNANGSDKPVAEGIKNVRRLICDGRGVRLLRIHPRCTHLIRELPAYRYDEASSIVQGGEPKPLKVDDHAPDALRYMSRHVWSAL